MTTIKQAIENTHIALRIMDNEGRTKGSYYTASVTNEDRTHYMVISRADFVVVVFDDGTVIQGAKAEVEDRFSPSITDKFFVVYGPFDRESGRWELEWTPTSPIFRAYILEN